MTRVIVNSRDVARRKEQEDLIGAWVPFAYLYRDSENNTKRKNRTFLTLYRTIDTSVLAWDVISRLFSLRREIGSSMKYDTIGTKDRFETYTPRRA